MRGSTFRFITAVTLCAGLFAGCEWTGSDSDSSWSGKYDDMNFSGTYRIGVSASGGTDGAGGVDTISVSEKAGTYSTGKASYSGKLHGGVVPGSVNISAGGYSYSDNGSGVLVGNVGVAGNGTINYSSGAWAFTVLNWGQIGNYPDSGDITAVYSYTTDVAGGGAVGQDEAKSLTAITVQQTGQNLTMIFSNGLTLTGKFSGVNELASAGGTTYNASFEVSSKGNKFVGTLNSTTGVRIIDGTWISGNNHYDVNGTAALRATTN